MKVIFLDVEGVMTISGEDAFSESAIDALKSIVASAGDIGIVISSSVRIGRSESGACRLVSGLSGIAMRFFLGVTPDFGGPRSREIQAWLDAYPQARFVILDDEEEMGHLSENLVSVNPELGLSAFDAAEVIRRLNVYN